MSPAQPPQIGAPTAPTSPSALAAPQQSGQAPTPPQSKRKQVADQIIQMFGDELKALSDKHCRMAVDREKIYQYALVRRNDFYFRGNQHLAPAFTGTGELIDFKPVNNQLLLRSQSSVNPNSTIYDYVINHFRGDIRKFVAVLGNKAPNVTARPAWQRDDNGIRRSGVANDCASYLRQQWDVDSANRYLCLSLAKNGTTFIHTPWVADSDRYGTHTEPVWGGIPQKTSPDGFQCKFCGTLTPGSPQAPPQVCSNPACRRPLGPEDYQEGQTEMVPGVTGMQTYANGTVELYIHSAYDVTTPFYIKDLRQCPWLFVDMEEDASVLVSRFPGRGLEDSLEQERQSSDAAGGSARALGELARIQASSPTGYGMQYRQNRWNYTRVWLRPHMYFYLLRSGTSQMDGKAAVAKLQQTFPRGLKLTFANYKLVDVEHERLDEVWAAVKPETSEYIYADPIFNDYIQGADIINDAWNINIQLLETSIPALLFDPNILDPRKVRNRGFQPNEFIPMIQGTGAMADKAFVRVPTSDPKPEIIQFQQAVIESLREIVGLLPAIWGGDENTQTAEQARRRLNQALMVLATTWNEIRTGWATAFRNGVRQLSRYSLGRLVSSQGDPESVTVQDLGDLAELLQGGWDFECDQAIPMNWTQLRDFVTEMFQMNPVMAHELSMDDYENTDKIVEGIGVPGWVLRKKVERDRVRDLIGRLMQGAPLQMPGPPPMPGMPPAPPVPTPSIPIDFQVVYNPNVVMEVIHDWCMSEDGRAAEGTPGFDNVIAAGMAALQAMAPPPGAPGAPPGPPAGPGGPRGGKGASAGPGQPASGPDATLPNPLQPANPPEAPEQPLAPLNPPPGALDRSPTNMVQ